MNSGLVSENPVNPTLKHSLEQWSLALLSRHHHFFLVLHERQLVLTCIIYVNMILVKLSHFMFSWFTEMYDI